jgi:hypothetical protein
MNYTRNAPEVIEFSKLNLSNLSYELKPFDIKDKKNKILTGFVNYADNGMRRTLLLKTKEITLSKYGYTSEEYISNESQKFNLKVPLSEDINSEEISKYEEWDEFLSTKQFKEQLFDSVAQQYKSCDDKASQKYKLSSTIKKFTDGKPPRISFKIDVDYETQTIKTKVFDNYETTPMNIETLDDFKKIVSFGSSFQIIFKIVKLWGHLPTLPEPGYGLIFKLYQVRMIKMNTYTINQLTTQSLFIDNNQLSEEIITSSKPQIETSTKPNVSVEHSDNSDESSNEVESDVEIVEKSSKNRSAAKSKANPKSSASSKS